MPGRTAKRKSALLGLTLKTDLVLPAEISKRHLHEARGVWISAESRCTIIKFQADVRVISIRVINCEERIVNRHKFLLVMLRAALGQQC